jgi:hypothetical protein
MKATRNLKIILELTEKEANDLYKHLHPKTIPNYVDDLKKEIVNALGYVPHED